MHPVLLKLGPITIHTYGLMVALGILSGVSLSEYLYRREGGEPGKVVDMALIVVLSGIVGSRILFVLVNLGYYMENPLEAIMIWQGGLVFYGGLIGGIGGLIISTYLYRLQLLRILDVGAIAIALGQSIGRIGCFSAGCCYGKPTDLPWAVIFTDPRSLAVSVLNTPVHPTQLYSFAGLFLITVYLVWLHPRKSFHGQLASAYLVLHGIFRFIVEIFRGDPRGSIELAGITLSTSQAVSLLIVPAGIILYIMSSRKPIESQTS